jgi:predicted nucleic acid-binding protein
MKMNVIGTAIEARIAMASADFEITAVSVFEMVAGAIALYEDLKKRRKDLIPGFNLIQEVVEYLGRWQGRVQSYDTASEQIYRGFTPRLRQELGNDARIAAVALARGAAVWTCNVDDFKKVPGLTVYRADTGAVVS